MKYFALLFALIVGGLCYVRFEQPQMWNQNLDAMKAPEPVAPPVATAESAPPAPRAPAAPVSPEIISPSSTAFINPDHVRQVDQPDPASATPATNTPAAGANAAAAETAPAQ